MHFSGIPFSRHNRGPFNVTGEEADDNAANRTNRNSSTSAEGCDVLRMVWYGLGLALGWRVC
jgi:hypothetical protein